MELVGSPSIQSIPEIEQHLNYFAQTVSLLECVGLVGCRVTFFSYLCVASCPQPPDRSQHGCTVGIDRDSTRVAPPPKQGGGSTRATALTYVRPGPAFRTHKLWIAPLFPCAGWHQRCTAFSGTPGLRNSFPRQWTHESGINSELRAAEQGQAINDHFESPLVHVVKTLVLTLPPPSGQIRATTFSNGNPRRPNTLATGHADRWWTRQSRRRPHRKSEQ